MQRPRSKNGDHNTNIQSGWQGSMIAGAEHCKLDWEMDMKNSFRALWGCFRAAYGQITCMHLVFSKDHRINGGKGRRNDCRKEQLPLAAEPVFEHHGKGNLYHIQ